MSEFADAAHGDGYGLGEPDLLPELKDLDHLGVPSLLLMAGSIACWSRRTDDFTYTLVFNGSWFDLLHDGLTRMIELEKPVPSPCVRNCCLDEDLNCLGCFRSIEEIKEWGVTDDQRRRVILGNAERRRAAYRAMHGEWPYSVGRHT